MEKLNSATKSIVTGCGRLHVTIVWNKDKTIKKIFSHMGKAGGCATAQLDAHSYAARLLLKADIPIETVAGCYKGINCHNQGENNSCVHAFGMVLEELVKSPPGV